MPLLLADSIANSTANSTANSNCNALARAAYEHYRFEEEKSRSGGYVTVREGSDGELYGLRPQELTLQDANGAVTVVNADVGKSNHYVLEEVV
jgi:hypothetical protein